MGRVGFTIKNCMYWASALQIRGTYASRLHKNAWGIVRMTRQWVYGCKALHNCHQILEQDMARKEECANTAVWGPPFFTFSGLATSRRFGQYFRFPNGYVTSQTLQSTVYSKIGHELGGVSTGYPPMDNPLFGSIQNVTIFAPQNPQGLPQSQREILQPRSFPPRRRTICRAPCPSSRSHVSVTVGLRQRWHPGGCKGGPIVAVGQAVPWGDKRIPINNWDIPCVYVCIYNIYIYMYLNFWILLVQCGVTWSNMVVRCYSISHLLGTGTQPPLFVRTLQLRMRAFTAVNIQVQGNFAGVGQREKGFKQSNSVGISVGLANRR